MSRDRILRATDRSDLCKIESVRQLDSPLTRLDAFRAGFRVVISLAKRGNTSAKERSFDQATDKRLPTVKDVYLSESEECLGRERITISNAEGRLLNIGGRTFKDRAD